MVWQLCLAPQKGVYVKLSGIFGLLTRQPYFTKRLRRQRVDCEPLMLTVWDWPGPPRQFQMQEYPVGSLTELSNKLSSEDPSVTYQPCTKCACWTTSCHRTVTEATKEKSLLGINWQAFYI